MDAEQLKAFEAQVRSVYKQMARLAITPEWAKLFDFGAGGFAIIRSTSADFLP